MKKLTYTEQLRHPFWQRRRLEALERANFRCENCCADQITLNVHHKRYVKGAMAWECDITDLMVLCEPCHEETHWLKERMALLLTSVPTSLQMNVIGLIAGYLAISVESLDQARIEECRQQQPDLFLAGALASEFEYLIGDLARVAGELKPNARLKLSEVIAEWEQYNREANEPIE